MKKEENGKKKGLAWLWILIAILAVLLIAGGVLAFILLGNAGNQDEVVEPEIPMSDLYWNVDRDLMIDPETGLSIREAAADGLYYLRLAVNGEQVEMPVADKKLVNRMDILDVFGLQFDAEGNVVDLIAPEEMYTKIGEKVFVQSIQGNTMIVNTSQALNGMQIPVTLTGNEGVFNVSTLDRPEYDGIADELEIMDQVLIYGSDESTAHTIYITDRFWHSDVYWRVERFYDSANKCSAREKAEDGYWYFDMAVNGKQVTLRTDRQDVINAIDGYGVLSACCGLVFDEEGNVIDCFNAAMAARGSVVANGYDVTELSEDGKTFTATRILFGTDVGKTYTATLGEDTGVFNVNSTAKMIGEVTDLQVGDRLYVIADPSGNPKVIYVINRMVDSPMYYLLNRSYSSANGYTGTADADGWYTLKFAVKGKQVTYKTKDFDLAAKINAYGVNLMGLKVSGNIVLAAYDPVCVSGNYSFASNYFVTSFAEPLLSAASSSGTSANGVLAEGCEIYDVSGVNRVKGKKTTVREGDRIVCYTNPAGEITHVYVVARYVAGTQLYWNINSRSYNGDTYTTKAEPNEEGYYTFKVIKAGGKEVELKTKSKDLASQFHSLATNAPIALKVSGTTLKGAYPGWAVVEGGGYYALANTTLTSQNEDGSYAALTTTQLYGTLRLDADYKAYNVAAEGLCKKHRGETTTVQLGDRVYPIYNSKGVAQYVFVTVRERDTEVYFKYDRKYNTTTRETTRTPDADGYYVYKVTVNGKVKEYKTKDKAIASQVDSYALGFGMKVSGNIIKAVYPAESAPEVYSGEVSYRDVTKISGNKITLKRNKPGQTDTGKTSEIELASNCKIYNVSSTAGDKWGLKDKLQKGDRVYTYKNNEGKTSIIYIMNENTRSDSGYAKCSHCGKTVWWEPLSAGYSVTAGYVPDTVHYYLDGDLQRDGPVAFGSTVNKTEEKGTDVILDLYGRTLTRKGTEVFDSTTGASLGFRASGSVLNVANGCTLTITNTTKTMGKIVAGEGVDFYGSTILLNVSSDDKNTEWDETATLIIEKGIIDASKAISSYTGANCGAISVGGKLIVNGGEITGPKSLSTAQTATGSAIGTWGGSYVTINGGIIRGCPSTGAEDYVGGAGAALAANSENAKVTINGGELIGSNVHGAGSAVYVRKAAFEITGGIIRGGVACENGTTIEISGSPKITSENNGGIELLNGTLVNVGKLNSDASIYISTTGVFTTDFATVDEAVACKSANNFTNDDYPVFVYGQALACGEYRCLYGHTTEDECDAAGCQEELTFWSKWTDATKLPTSGNYYLETDVTATATANLSGNLVLDLKGHTITREISASDKTTAFGVGQDQDLRLCDSTANPGKIVATFNGIEPVVTGSSGLISSSSPKTESGVITKAGGDVRIDRITVDGSNMSSTYTGANSGVVVAGGDMVINDATIKGYTSTTGQGTAIGSWGRSTITINGNSTIIGGNATGGSGGVIAANGNVTVNGGTFSVYEGTAAARHGGIIGMANGELVINGGTFYGNATTYYGAVINHGSRPTTINGGTFYAAKAAEGGIIRGSGKLTINGGTFIGVGTDADNKSGNGGLIMNNGKELTILGGTFKNGNASGYGCNIYYTNDGGTLTIAGTADIAGEVRVYVADGATANLVVGGKALVDWTRGEYSVKRNLMLTNTNIYLGDTSGEPIYQVGATTELLSLTHDAEGNVTGVTTGSGETTPSVTEWTDATSLPTTGEYKLMTDVTVSAATSLTGNLTIDLNGYNITRNVAAGTTSAEQVFTVGDGKTLTIKDTNEEKEGTVKAVHAGSEIVDGYAGVIHGTSGSKIVIDGGIIDGSNLVMSGTPSGKSVNSGTVMVGGELTVNGGVIKGLKKTSNSSSSGGSAIAAWGSTKVTINGGEIIAYQAADDEYATSAGSCVATGGELTINGGTLIPSRVSARGAAIACTNSNGVLTITGGEIGGSYAKSSGGTILWQGKQATISGGHVAAGTTDGIGSTIDFYNNGGTLTINGTAKVDGGIYVRAGADKTAAKLVVDGKASIFATGDFADIELANAAGYVGDATTASVTNTDAATALECIVTYDTNGNVTGIQAATAAWPEWTSTTSLPASGTWKLADNVTLSAAYANTGDLKLDLNGKTITRTVAAGTTKATYAMYTAAGTKVLLTDSSATPGTVTTVFADGANTITDSTGVIGISERKKDSTTGEITTPYAELYLEKITVDGSHITSTYTAANGGAIAVGGKLVLNDATVKGFKTTSGKGTAIGSWGTSDVIINEGAVVIGGNATGAAGGVIAANNNVTVNGGTFSVYEGTAASKHGGIIGMGDNGELVINGGTFTGHETTYYGAVINNGTRPTTINGGTFYAAKASEGGVIRGSGKLTITGGTFIGVGSDEANKTGNGGLIYNNGTSVTITGGTFKNGHASGWGCNIAYTNANGVLTIAGTADIAGEVRCYMPSGKTGTISLVLGGKALVDYTRGDFSMNRNLMLSNTKVYLNDTTGEAIYDATGTSAVLLNLTHDADGNVTGVVAP